MALHFPLSKIIFSAQENLLIKIADTLSIKCLTRDDKKDRIEQNLYKLMNSFLASKRFIRIKLYRQNLS